MVGVIVTTGDIDVGDLLVKEPFTDAAVRLPAAAVVRENQTTAFFPVHHLASFFIFHIT